MKRTKFVQTEQMAAQPFEQHKAYAPQEHIVYVNYTLVTLAELNCADDLSLTMDAKQNFYT